MNIKKNFENEGFLIVKNESKESLDLLCKTVQNTFKSNKDLDKIHLNFDYKDINKYRLNCFKKLNQIRDWENLYFKQCEEALYSLIGLDISIQTKLNLSIQMPKDTTSSLGLHSDTLSGQSEYEVVVWTPLADAFESNSMYIFDKKVSKLIYQDLNKFEFKGMDKLYNKYKKHAKFLNVKKGEILIFSSSLFHGNIINRTKKTRLSINCRFKSIFAPELEDFPTERSSGSFYKPLKISPVTKWGLKYKYNKIKF